MSQDLIVGLVVAGSGATVGWVLAGVSRFLRGRKKESESMAVWVHTLNENSMAIGALESEVTKLSTKVANFEGLLTARMNYRNREEG